MLDPLAVLRGVLADRYALSFRGQSDAGIREMQRAVELDPLAPSKQNSLAGAFYRAGRYDEALQYYREIPDPDFNSEMRHRNIAAIYERQGRLGDVMAEWLLALRLDGKEDVAASVERRYRSSGYAEGRRTYLRADLRESLRRAQNAYPRPPASAIAGDYALLGERDSAFAWLERAFRERDGKPIFLTVDERWDTLRPDPRFRDLAHRMGLPDTVVN
jgi:tetratricopeptide (TPR) repeat protein